MSLTENIYTKDHIWCFAGFLRGDMTDLAGVEVRIGAASNTVDLWLEVGWWLPISCRALLGVIPAMATSEACVVAAAVL